MYVWLSRFSVLYVENLIIYRSLIHRRYPSPSGVVNNIDSRIIRATLSIFFSNVSSHINNFFQSSSSIYTMILLERLKCDGYGKDFHQVRIPTVRSWSDTGFCWSLRYSWVLSVNISVTCVVGAEIPLYALQNHARLYNLPNLDVAFLWNYWQYSLLIMTSASAPLLTLSTVAQDFHASSSALFFGFVAGSMWADC